MHVSTTKPVSCPICPPITLLLRTFVSARGAHTAGGECNSFTEFYSRGKMRECKEGGYECTGNEVRGGMTWVVVHASPV